MHRFQIHFVNLLILLLTCLGSCYIQEIVLFGDENQKGTILTITTHVPDASAFPQLAKTQTFCVRGIWTFFRSKHFTGFMYTLMSRGNLLTCSQGKLPDNPLSFRYGGEQDSTEVAISIYSKSDFEGAEAIIRVNDSGINLQGQSVTYTGKRRWTLYENSDFTGNSVCTESFPNPQFPQQEVGSYYDIRDQLHLQQVGSVHAGCSKIKFA